MESFAHCPRCRKDVPVEHPWAGWMWLKRGWVATMLVVLLLSPIMASDLIVMMPTGALIALAGSTIFREAARIPRCRRCQFPMDGTPNPYDAEGSDGDGSSEPSGALGERAG